MTNHEDKTMGENSEMHPLQHLKQEIAGHMSISEKSSKLVISIVEKGQGKRVCTYMKQAGAFGSTIVLAQGTAKQAILDLWGLENTDRELILSFLPSDKANTAVDEVCAHMGMHKQGGGIIFSIDIERFAGQQALMKLMRLYHKAQHDLAAHAKEGRK